MSRLRKRWLAAACVAVVAATIGLTLPAFAGLNTGTVSGSFTDGGAPVAAVPVTLSDTSDNVVASGTTNNTGSYSLVDVPDGDYRLSFTLPGYLVQYVPQTFDANQAGVVTVAAGGATIVDESVAPHGSLIGHVTRSDGSAVPYPYVLAQSNQVYVQLSGDANGDYVLPYVPAGTYVVSFRDGYDGPEQFAHQKSRSWLADPIVVAAGGPTTLDETFLALGAIAGHLTDAGQPVAGAYVSAENSTGGSGAWAITGPDGSYRLKVFPETYRVRFDLPSGLVQYAHQHSSASSADPIVVAAGPDTIVDEQVLPTGTISGHLTDSAGSPVSGTSVQLINPANEIPGYAYTDADGAYQATVFAGVYTVEFDTANGPQWAHGRTSFATADPITVTGGATVTVDDGLLPTGSVTITARDSVTGLPVTDFCAQLTGIWNSPCTQDGTATATVQPGGFDLSIYPNTTAYLYKHVGVVQVSSGQTTTVVVDLTPSATLRTTVREAKTGAPVEGICLELVKPLNPTGLGTGGAVNCSDATGQVTVPQLAAGTYTVFAWASDSVHGDQWVGADGGVGAQAKARLVKLTAGAAVTIPDIKVDRRGTVTGLILDEKTHLPMPYTIAGWSTANAGFGGTWAQVGTDSAGRYTMDNLGPYEWTLYFQAFGYASEFSGNTPNRFDATGVKVKSGQTTTYNVGLGKGVTLTGTVTRSNGQPAGGVRITVVHADSGDETGVNDTGPDGKYTIQVLGEQRVKLRIESYGDGNFVVYWYVSAADFASATPVRIPTKGTKTLNITLPPPAL